MKKVSKSKKGFTLVEMVLVIAIICILAAVIFNKVSEYLAKASTATATMQAYYAEVDTITAQIS
ncbi:MAG: type II secretion system GspH family protein [Clostridia bacterium]|nr:type II secretion system GspH family protein [Clostridia bacterium]